MPGVVKDMFPVPSQPSHLVLVLEEGTVLLASTSQNGSTSIVSTLSAPTKFDIVRSWIFAPTEHIFPGLGNTDVFVCVTHSGKHLDVRVFPIQDESIVLAGMTRLIEDEIARHASCVCTTRLEEG